MPASGVHSSVISPADADDPLGVGNRLGRFADDVLVARLLPRGDQTRADPPHHRVEPEERLDQHVDRCGEVVATTHVTDLMPDHRGKLVGGQVRIDPHRQENDRLPETNDAGFERGGRDANLNVVGHIRRPSSACSRARRRGFRATVSRA
jgi:hypothetical protein